METRSQPEACLLLPLGYAISFLGCWGLGVGSSSEGSGTEDSSSRGWPFSFCFVEKG